MRLTSRCTRTAAKRVSSGAPGSLDAGFAASARLQPRSVIFIVGNKNATPMHLITPGRIKIDSVAKTGQLLLTDQSIFVLESAANGSSTGVALGGLLGYFIGRYLDRRKAKRNPPEHLQDLEIAGLEDKIREGLLTTKLIVKLPLNQRLQIKPTRLGFQFTVAGQPCVSYAGWAHKKKILRFFADHGVHVDVA